MVLDRKYTVGSNADVLLRFDPTEVIPNDVPREMGFKLAQGRDGPLYQAYDDASRAIVDHVLRAGFSIDPQTLEISFKKDDWSGPFGAYRQVPGDNRPAFTIGFDHRRRNPILAPRMYTSGVGSGQATLPARMSGAVEFKNVWYICVAGRKVYKLDNWGTPGAAYFTEVFEHSDVDAVLRDLIVFENKMYVAAGETAAYAYTSDGSSWTESTLGDPHDKAEQFAVINDSIHKIRVPNLHYTTNTPKGEPINGGTAWANADAMGDAGDVATMTALELLGQNDSTLIAKEEGIFNVDSSGNPQPLYPELQKLRDNGNGFHAFVWNNVLFYPTFRGELLALKEGRIYKVTPALMQERRLETSPRRDGTFLGRVRAMAGTVEYLYVEVKRAEDGFHRILVLEYDGGVNFTWRTLLDVPTTTSDELFVTSGSTAGPVLWATTADEYGNKAAYWIIAVGPDPTQDSRARYTNIGVLYDPWIDFGIPTTNKAAPTIEIESIATADDVCTLIMRAIADDGTTTMRSITPGKNGTFSKFRLPKSFIHKRVRFEWEGQTTDAEHTPIPLSYRVSAIALPEPVRIWQWTAKVPAAGAGGLATQPVTRKFLHAIRRATMPMTFVDPFGDEWPVITFPPPPAEVATKHDTGRWDEGWAVSLIEVVTREWELTHPGPDEEEPPGDPEPPLPPGENWPGTGGCPTHAWASGVIGGAPWIAECRNLADDNTGDWTLIGTGGDLPGSASTCVLIQDPFPAVVGEDRAWCLIDDVELYYADNTLGPDTTWTKVLDETIAGTSWGNTLDSSGTPESWEIRFVQTSIVAPGGYIAVFARGGYGTWPTGESHLLIHSHDRGLTWFVRAVFTSDAYVGTILSAELHQRDQNRFYVAVSRSPSVSNKIYYTTDHGHNIAGGATYSGSLDNSANLLCPYIIDLDVVYLKSTLQAMAKSVTAGQSLVTTAVSPDLAGSDGYHKRPHDIIANWDPLAFHWIVSGSPDVFWKSTDGLATAAATSANLGNFGNMSGYMINLVREAVFMIGIQSATRSRMEAWCGPDWEEWNQVTGDLNTVVGAGGTLQCLNADWRTGA